MRMNCSWGSHSGSLGQKELLWRASCITGIPALPPGRGVWRWPPLGDPWLFRWVSWALTGCGSLAHCVHCPKRGQSGQVEALSSLPFLSRHVPTSVEDTHPQAGCHFLVVNVNNVIVRGPVGLRYCVEHVPLAPTPSSDPSPVSPFCWPRQVCVYFHAI